MMSPTASVEPTNLSVMLVDDDEPLRYQLGKALTARGFDVLAAADYDEAMELALARAPQRAVIDLKMPGRSGLELLKDLKQALPEIDVVVLTGFGSIANAVDAMRLGAINYVTKPADADQVLLAFEKGDQPPEAAAPSYEPPTLAQAEWEHIQRTLSECQGNITEAAFRLGIPRRSLQRKLKKLAP